MARGKAERSEALERLNCTPFITYCTMHSEVLETLMTLPDRQRATLAGAFVTYFSTGEEPKIPKNLRLAWTPLKISARKTRENILRQVKRGGGAPSGGTSGAPSGGTSGAPSGGTSGAPSGLPNVRSTQHLALNTQHLTPSTQHIASTSITQNPSPRTQHPAPSPQNSKEPPSFVDSMIPAGATDTEHATDAETREHDELELRLMSGEGTDADKARYSKLHPKVCARKVAESGGEGEEG